MSSRDCAEYIREIQFLGITLLPFTREQLQKFILGWFGEGRKGELLWDQIRGNALFDVAKNPLLATIICSLHDNNIPVPDNEPDVYRKKVELLSGQYDRFKGISRLKTRQEYLLRACRKIGFRMHLREQREASVANLIEYYFDEGSSGVDSMVAELAVRELINPCNLLRRNPGSETYGFEHLRIQEFLAAEELSHNRGVEIVPLLSREWWRGALYLYAFGNDFAHLIEDCYHKSGSVLRAVETIRTMITTQPKKRQVELTGLLERYTSQDAIDRMYTEDDDGDGFWS